MPKTSKTHSSSKRILSVTIKRMLDDSPDTSYLGEYANSPTSEFSIDRAHSEDCNSVTGDGAKLDRVAAYVEKLAQEEQDCFGDSSELEALNSAWDELQQIADSFDDCDCGGRGDMERNQYRYFNPSFNYVDKHGKLVEGNTAEDVRKYVRQDYERMERLNRGDWHYMGIRAEAKVGIEGKEPSRRYHFEGWTMQTITSGGLYGIESYSGNDYIQSIEQEELSELRAQLKALGFSARAISVAFKTIDRKDA